MSLKLHTIFNNHLKGKIFLFLSLVGISISTISFYHFLDNQKKYLLNQQLIHFFPLITAIFLYFLATIIRSYNYKKLIHPIKEISLFQSFKYLTTGSLFNTFLPFRLGEFIRAHITGKNTSINRSAIFFTIITERLIDSYIVIALFLITSKLAIITIDIRILYLTIPVIVTTYVFILLTKENMVLLKFIYYFTEIFNYKIKNTIRFSIWSIIYTSRKLFCLYSTTRYILTSINMWTVYLLASYTLTQSYILLKNPILSIYSSILPYISSAFPSGPGYVGTYHIFYSNQIKRIISISDIFPLSISTWFLMIIPITFVGITFLILQNKKERSILENFFTNQTNYSTTQNIDKLSKTQLFSEELSEFLGNYFSGIKLAQVLNSDELNNNISILKVFKGGSNAITALVSNKNKIFIRKTTLFEYANRLKAQYRWLKKRQSTIHIPKIIGTDSNLNSYSIDIKYYDNYSTFFDYIHSHQIDQSLKILNKIIQYADKHIYTKHQKRSSLTILKQYIDTKIIQKVENIIVLSDQLKHLVNNHKKIILNGNEYSNFDQIINKITEDQSIMSFLSKYEETEIHGDLTIDNILIGKNNFILLDPLDENIISDKVVDYGKLYQSIHSGYEFLVNITSIELNKNIIFYKNKTSKQYSELYEYINRRFKQELLDNNRYLQIQFHEAVHYFRMLPYKVILCPQTLPMYYAIGVKLLNEFYNDYKHTTEQKIVK